MESGNSMPLYKRDLKTCGFCYLEIMLEQSPVNIKWRLHVHTCLPLELYISRIFNKYACICVSTYLCACMYI